jgi:hypothetical protein
MGKRLLNKGNPLSSQKRKLEKESVTYIRALKKFQKETRGLLPESEKVKEIRNRIHREMRLENQANLEKARQEAGSHLTADAIVQDFKGSFYNLLIVKPEVKDCYETIAVLNYNGFPMDVEEENWRGQVAEEMGFGKSPEYPCLNIDSDSQEMDSQGVMEKNAIFASLF